MNFNHPTRYTLLLTRLQKLRPKVRVENEGDGEERGRRERKCEEVGREIRMEIECKQKDGKKTRKRITSQDGDGKGSRGE